MKYNPGNPVQIQEFEGLSDAKTLQSSLQHSDRILQLWKATILSLVTMMAGTRERDSTRIPKYSTRNVRPHCVTALAAFK